MTDRLKYYRKISACKNVEDIKKISKDLVDQCGKLPTAVKNLLYDAEIALTATEIISISISIGIIICSLSLLNR